jgi:uncharacterized protein (AIM24 family)
MEERLIGTTALVLSIVLAPGESVVAETGEFAWMTDSIEMSTTPAGGELPVSMYTARAAAGTVAFAARLPGSIVAVDISPGREVLVHYGGFLAGTSAIEVTADFGQSFTEGAYAGRGFPLRRIGGAGRAWVELSGEPVRHELAAGESLRARPGHVAMVESTVSVQLTRVPGMASRYFGDDAHHFAVLSGPGTAWLQSTPLPVLAASLSPYLPPSPKALPEQPPKPATT